MKQYSLLREDLDNLLEVSQWPDRENPMKDVDSKVKAAFTRQYNKDIVLPYSAALGGVNRKRSLASLDQPGEEDEFESEEESDDDDITKYAMIKAKKPKLQDSKSKEHTIGRDNSGKMGKGGRGGKRSRK